MFAAISRIGGQMFSAWLTNPLWKGATFILLMTVIYLIATRNKS